VIGRLRECPLGVGEEDPPQGQRGVGILVNLGQDELSPWAENPARCSRLACLMVSGVARAVEISRAIETSIWIAPVRRR
jgi:hypothetical protein